MEKMYKQIIDSFYNDFVIYNLQRDNKLNNLIIVDIDILKDYHLFFNTLLKRYKEEKKYYEKEFKNVFNYNFLMTFLKNYFENKLSTFDDPIFRTSPILFAFLKSSLVGLMKLHYEGVSIDEKNIEFVRVDGSMSYKEIEGYLNTYDFNRFVLQPTVFLDTTYRLFCEFSCFNAPDYIVLLQLINTYLEDRVPKDYKKYLIDLEDFTQYDYDFKYFLDKNLKIYTEFVKKEFKTDVYEYKPEGKVVTKDELRFGFVSVKSDINSILEYFCNSVISNTHNLLAPSVVDIHSPYRIYAGIYKDRRKLMDDKYKAMGKVYTPPKIFKYWPWIPGEEDSGYWSDRG